jgi:hypothetical protein
MVEARSITLGIGVTEAQDSLSVRIGIHLEKSFPCLEVVRR